MSFFKKITRHKTVEQLQSEAGQSQDFRRTMGVWQLTAIGVGAIVGVGVFVLAPHEAATHAGPAIVLSFLGDREDVHAVVLPRTAAQREHVRALRLPSVVLAEQAVDAQSLIAFSDLVVSAGGSMNREAVALGVPVYTTYGGRLGGVDEALIRTGRLRPLSDVRALELHKREKTLDWPRRDPQVLVDMILSAPR